jgi:plasmid stability protein
MRVDEETMANLQVKGIDDELYRALKARARLDNRSVSQEVVMLIEEFLARGGGSGRRPAAALLEIAGTWVDDRSAEEIAEDVRAARRPRRKPKRL